jgi:tetratricopeptide (TPR) repeat protein
MADVGTLISEGWAAHRSGKNDEALRQFENALSLENDNIDAYYGIGLAERARRRLPEATAAFEKSLQLTRDKLALTQPDPTLSAVEVPDIDRYMMLIRMIGQRLAEIRSLGGTQAAR